MQHAEDSDYRGGTCGGYAVPEAALIACKICYNIQDKILSIKPDVTLQTLPVR